MEYSCECPKDKFGVDISPGVTVRHPSGLYGEVKVIGSALHADIYGGNVVNWRTQIGGAYSPKEYKVIGGYSEVA